MKNIHILSTDKPSRLSDCHDNKLHLDDTKYLKKYQNIYITSDEEIKDENWVITPNPHKTFRKSLIKKHIYHIIIRKRKSS
jgi:hypothetical protein